RVAGNRRLYVSLLRKFADGQRGAAQAIEAALQARDNAQAKHLAHALKGVSGNIGAVGVQEIAAQIERGAGAGEDVRHLGARLASELATVLDALQAALPPLADAHAGAASARDAHEIIVRLDAYLADSDGDASEYVAEHALT